MPRRKRGGKRAAPNPSTKTTPTTTPTSAPRPQDTLNDALGEPLSDPLASAELKDPIANKPLSEESQDSFLAAQVSAREADLEALSGRRFISSKAKGTGSVALGGGGPTVKTLTGGPLGGLENRLNNPKSTEAHPRKGIVDRQASIMSMASKADPLLDALESTGSLSASHEKKPLTNSKRTKAGTSWGGDTLTRDSDGSDVFTFGMDEFGNREGVLPELGTASGPTGDGRDARTNRWSEADVNPVTKTGIASDGKVSLQGRGTERLLFTNPNSRRQAPDGKGGTSEAGMDFSTYLTDDHYKSVVPVSPVAKDYKANNAYTSPYMDPEGRLSSLALHDKKVAEANAPKTEPSAPIPTPKAEPAPKKMSKSARRRANKRAKKQAAQNRIIGM